jgi:8-oxo-dGTP diphosphatase
VYWRIGGPVALDAPAEPAEPVERFQRVAAYGIARDGDLVLLSRLSRSPHQGRWTLPGGGLEFGERPADAVVREVHEETGLHVRVEELLDADAELWSFRRDGGRREAHAVRFAYRVTVLGGTLGVVEVDGSTDDARWWPMSGLPELTPMTERTLRTGRLNG